MKGQGTEKRFNVRVTMNMIHPSCSYSQPPSFRIRNRGNNKTSARFKNTGGGKQAPSTYAQLVLINSSSSSHKSVHGSEREAPV